MSYPTQRLRVRLACEQLEPRRCLTEVSFVSHVLATEVAWPSSLSTADVDGDGDTDILHALVLDDDALAWYENTDGQGTFGTQQLIRYREPSINVLVPRVRSVDVSDLDGDQDVDILTALSGTFRDIDPNKIVWQANTDGKGTLGQQNVITTDGFGVKSVSASDVDGDGDADVLATSSVIRQQDGVSLEDEKITWYENTDGQGTFGPSQTIGTEVDGSHQVRTVDMDGDGDMDVVNGRFWYENTDREQTFGPQKSLPGTSTGDLDGDGDMDVVSVEPLRIAWYENTDGKGKFGPGQIIAPRSQVLEVLVVDVDSDGDADVLTRQADGDRLGWYENEDGKGTFGQRRSITEKKSGVTSFHATDFDGDSDLDVLATTFALQQRLSSATVGKLIWYENLLPPLLSRRLGDANRDGQFDQVDVIQIQQAGKFLTGQPAAFEEGDWNGDGVFNQLDLVLALQSGNYSA